MNLTSQPPMTYIIRFLRNRFLCIMHAWFAAALSVLLGLLTNLASAQQPTRPNILFIIFDDWSGSTHAGAYGCTWIKTPNFDRVAREGVLFKNAFTSNPKCSPCRASIL